MNHKLPLTVAFLSGFLGYATAAQEQFPQQNGSVDLQFGAPVVQECVCDICPEQAAIIPAQACPEPVACPELQCPEVVCPETQPCPDQPTPQETRQRSGPSPRRVQRALTLAGTQLQYASAFSEAQALRQLLETGTSDAGQLQPRVEQLQGSCTDLEQQFSALRIDYAQRTGSLREELRRLEELIQRGPIFTVRPGLGVEVYDGTPAAVITADLCARAAEDDIFGVCLGGTLYVAGGAGVAEAVAPLTPEQRTHEGDYTSTSTGRQTTRRETEGTGALSIATNIRAAQGNPSVDVQLGAAVRFAEERTTQLTDRTDRLYNAQDTLVGAPHNDRYETATPEELTDRLAPYAGVVFCNDNFCLDVRGGMGVEDGSFLFQGAFRYEIE